MTPPKVEAIFPTMKEKRILTESGNTTPPNLTVLQGGSLGDFVLTKDEVAAAWKVSPNTIQNWMDEGLLVRNRHYFKIKRVVRFPSEKETLLKALMEASIKSQSKEKARAKKVVNKGKKASGSGSQLNWDILNNKK